MKHPWIDRVRRSKQTSSDQNGIALFFSVRCQSGVPAAKAVPSNHCHRRYVILRPPQPTSSCVHRPQKLCNVPSLPVVARFPRIQFKWRAEQPWSRQQTAFKSDQLNQSNLRKRLIGPCTPGASDHQPLTLTSSPREKEQRRYHSKYKIWSQGKDLGSIPFPSRYLATEKLRTSFGLNQRELQNKIGSQTIVVVHNRTADVKNARMRSVREGLCFRNGQILTQRKDRYCTWPGR